MLKRCLVLAFGLVLFVTAVFIHQYWFDATQVEGKFRTERENFHVEGVNLVSTTPPGPASGPADETFPCRLRRE